MDDWSEFAKNVYLQKYSKDGTETWADTARRVAYAVLSAAPSIAIPDPLFSEMTQLIRERKFLPGGRYLYAAGRPYHQTQNCLLLRAEDSSDGWAEMMFKVTAGLMSGAGVGIDYSALRGYGETLKTKGGFSTGPIALMEMVNEAGRHIMQGGARRAALWAGLRWDHPDVWKFVNKKDWSPLVKSAKQADFNFPAPLDNTNVSVILDKAFFDAYEAGHAQAQTIYHYCVKSMLSTGEPGFSVDYHNPNESLRNACTEICSEDDSDICNLGSVNMARIETIEEFAEVVRLGTLFLLAGTLYSDLPYPKVGNIRTKNRRLGLGIMGVHEWLLKRGFKYGSNAQLARWLEVYATVSRQTADDCSTSWGITRPIKVRSIAPTGTIGIIAETTTGIEPIFCVAYRRRYRGPDGTSTRFEYVVDPTAKRLIDGGVSPAQVEDAYDLAADTERRIAFQAWVQQYVDHGISSTLNLPPWGSEENNEAKVIAFGDMLMRYLPKLRGITVYPDGARGGQPLTRVNYDTAMKHAGQVFLEQQDQCELNGSGTCGS